MLDVVSRADVLKQDEVCYYQNSNIYATTRFVFDTLLVLLFFRSWNLYINLYRLLRTHVPHLCMLSDLATMWWIFMISCCDHCSVLQYPAGERKWEVTQLLSEQPRTFTFVTIAACY